MPSGVSVESLLEYNPLRGYVRELMEVKPLRAATRVGRIPRALHIACGNGSSTRQILKHFAPERLSGVDRDPALVAAARESVGSDAVEFSVQDVSSLDFPEGSFDAAFDLADLHNTARWRECVLELRRVLAPGGLLVLEELSRETFRHGAGRVFKALTEHPYEDMLGAREFRDFVQTNGFEVLHFAERCPLGLLKYFTLVARKA